ncbi:MAG: zinc ribbon domain-containing protein [Elusimicrobiota bacterium]
MAITREAMRALVALQDKDIALDAIQKDIDSVPPRLAAVQADLANEKKRMDAAKATTLELEKKKKSKELDAAAKEEGARKHTAQLNELKSNDAYKAMQAEIDKEKAAVGDIETEILQIMEDIDKSKAAEKAVAAELKKIEDFSKNDLAKLEAELSHAKARHAEAKAARDAAAEPVPADLMKVFNHIRSRGKPDAVVPVVDGHCGSCQMTLSPAMIAEVAKIKSLAVCESCQRILYKPETPATAAAQ